MQGKQGENPSRNYRVALKEVGRCKLVTLDEGTRGNVEQME